MDDNSLVILFQSTHHAVRGEQVAKDAGFKVRCIPTPRHISSDCGIVLRISECDKDGILEVYEGKRVSFDRVEALGKREGA